MFEQIKESLNAAKLQPDSQSSEPKERGYECDLDLSENKFKRVKKWENRDDIYYIRESEPFKVYDPDFGEYILSMYIGLQKVIGEYNDEIYNEWNFLGLTIHEGESLTEEDESSFLNQLVEYFEEENIFETINEFSYYEDEKYDEKTEILNIKNLTFTKRKKDIEGIICYLAATKSYGELVGHWKKEFLETGKVMDRYFWSVANQEKHNFEFDGYGSFLEEVNEWSFS